MKLSLTSPSFHNNLHEICRRLRHDNPVARGTSIAWQKCWYVSRYEDVNRLLRGKDLIKEVEHVEDGKSRRGLWLPKSVRKAQRNLLFMDEPEHRRLRLLVQQAFTPARARDLDDRVAEIADEQADLLIAEGTSDFLNTFATPIPVRVIAELVGVPRSEQPRFLAMAQRAMRPPSLFGALDQLRAIRECLAYIQELSDKRRREPEDDLMTALVQAETEGSTLSDDELQAMVFVLLTAGFETTRGLISNGLLALLNNPAALDHLRAHPELLPVAIEELLRFDSPLLSTELYYAKRPLQVAGVDIAAGDMVVPLLISANRDEEKFNNPDELDIQREPNRHLAFGVGIHYCLGAPLARLEARVAFEVLFRRLELIELAVPASSLKRTNLMITNGLKALPVKVSASSARRAA